MIFFFSPHFCGEHTSKRALRVKTFLNTIRNSKFERCKNQPLLPWIIYLLIRESEKKSWILCLTTLWNWSVGVPQIITLTMPNISRIAGWIRYRNDGSCWNYGQLLYQDRSLRVADLYIVVCRFTPSTVLYGSLLYMHSYWATVHLNHAPYSFHTKCWQQNETYINTF